jgi:hypothetical protein
MRPGGAARRRTAAVLLLHVLVLIVAAPRRRLRRTLKADLRPQREKDDIVRVGVNYKVF